MAAGAVHAEIASASASPELSSDDVEALLTELLAGYGSEAFQGELEQLRADCAMVGQHPLLAMAPVCLKVQAPILEKYGQPPNSEGVDLMKHAVERRVAEGNFRIELLANRARAILGIAAMPDRRLTAEAVLAAKAAETEARLGLSAPGCGEMIFAQCLQRIAAEAASGALPAASAKYLEAAVTSREVPVPAVMALLKMGRLGHTVSVLGGDALPVQVSVLDAPRRDVFFREHVLPNRPAVLRGVLSENSFPPLRNFSDVDFLRRRCGNRRVLVKSLAHCDEDGRPVFVSDPELKLPLHAFLDSLESHEQSGSPQPFYLGKVPLRRYLPELVEEIESAATCPRRVYGDAFGALVPDGVFTYFGCGRNTTAVHFDPNENLLLCICGSKRLWLYPPSDARHLYPCNDFSRSAVLPFRWLEDYPDDTRDRFKDLAGSRPLEVRLFAGDMLYLPSCWWHCVEGSDERNMILNWWFAMHPDKKALASAPA